MMIDRDLQVRSLSSGTISACMIDDALTEPLRCRNSWVVDRYHDRFARWVDCCGREFSCWQDAWNAYVQRIREVTGAWKCGYGGATDFDLPVRIGGPLKLEVRHSCMGSGFGWNNCPYDYWKLGVQPRVGTICNRSDVCAWVPDEIACLFPCYVPSRLHPDYQILAPEYYVQYHPDWGIPETESDTGDQIRVRGMLRWDEYRKDSELHPAMYDRYVQKIRSRR